MLNGMDFGITIGDGGASDQLGNILRKRTNFGFSVKIDPTKKKTRIWLCWLEGKGNLLTCVERLPLNGSLVEYCPLIYSHLEDYFLIDPSLGVKGEASLPSYSVLEMRSAFT